jgi:hypothetical protein
MNLTATEEASYLRLLAIAHYVLGGIVALFGCFPLIHLTVGIGLLSGSAPFPTSGHGMPEAMGTMMGSMFVIVAGTMIAMFWTLAGLMFGVGRSLLARKHHTFCLVVSFVETLFAPIGTVLGILTIVLLMRDSVRKDFAGDATDEPAVTDAS